MQALDVSNPHDKTGLGALSVNFKSPIVIDNETWPSVLNYVLAQALCSDVYKNILRNHQSGFRIFKSEQLSIPKKRNIGGSKIHWRSLTQQQKFLDKLIDEWGEMNDEEDILKKEHEISQFIDSLEPEIKKRFLSEVVNPLKLQSDVFKKDIQEGKVVVTLLSQWDAREGDLKSNLVDFSRAVDFLPSKFITVSAKDIWMAHGGEIVNLEKYRQSREAVKREAQSQALSRVAKQSGKTRQKVPVQIYRSVLEKILQDPILLKQALQNQGVDDFEFPSLDDEDTRENLIQNLNEIISRMEDSLIPLEDYIRLTMQLSHITKQKINPEELVDQWKSLSIEEKSGYFRPIMPVFQDLLFRCRLESVNTFLNEVYNVVLNNPTYSDFLLSTTGNVPRNLIYLDPFDKRAPLLGVGIINEHFIGSNNVGKVLEQNRSRLLVRKRDIVKEQLLLKKKEKQREFYIAYSQLRNLMRTRDIAEFVDQTVPEILETLTSSVVVSTPKRGHILYGVKLPEESGDEVPEELLVAVKRSGANIDLHNPDTSWEPGQNKKFPDHPESWISYSFNQNRDFMNDYFVYEQSQPGNLANFLRKQFIEDLYNRQVNLEKIAYLRGFLTYMFLVDPQKRIEDSIIPTVVDHEMANMHSTLKIATEIDNIVQSEEPEEGFRELFTTAYPGCEIPLNITEDSDEIDIVSFLENFVEEQRSKGELAERVRTDTKDKAKAWRKKTHLTKRQVVTRKSPQNTDVQDLPLKDRLIAATLSIGNKTDNKPYTPHEIEPIDDIVSVITKEIPPVAGTGDIIFSSDPKQGGEQNFPLSPTENLRVPVRVEYFIFPTILHATCFLWLSKKGGLNSDRAFLRLLKPAWVNLVNDMGLFPEDEEAKRAMHPMIYFSEPLSIFDNKLATILTEIVQESLPSEDVSIPTVLHHLFYLKSNDAFLPWHECWSITMGELDQHLIRNMASALEKAHRVKFEDAKLVEILLLTGESYLVNFDRRDNILGGKRKEGGIDGLNLVGEDLMMLRQQLISESGIKPLLLSEDQILSLSNIMLIRMTAFKNLIEIIYKTLLVGGSEVETYVLTLKLARGIVSLYKMNCGTGLQIPFALSHLLQGVAKSFEDTIPKGSNDLVHQTSDLVWSFAKVIFSCVYEGKNMEWEKRETITDACKLRAEKLIRIFMDCLVRKFGDNKYFPKIVDLTRAIISDNIGRTAYFGSINFKAIREHQLRDIVEGKLDYHNFQKISPRPQVIDC
jgi:thiamine phosphate synthase YjbQ (UPF0047 family)